MEKTCFMIQPFDGGKFDKLFEDLFDPAVRDGGLLPYRVDRDPGVSIPIDEIEAGIRTATICFAEISTDNPNVWFELGYALALNKQVILVCGKGRLKYPFDIQHRTVISYESEAPRDFKNLQQNITARAQALVNKEVNQEQIRITAVVPNAQGLSPHEVTCLATIAAQSEGIEGSVSLYQVKSEMEKAGFNNLATVTSLRFLNKNHYISMRQEQEWNNNDTYEAYYLTDIGWDWVVDNLHLLNLRINHKPALPHEDDLPF